MIPFIIMSIITAAVIASGTLKDRADRRAW